VSVPRPLILDRLLRRHFATHRPSPAIPQPTRHLPQVLHRKRKRGALHSGEAPEHPKEGFLWVVLVTRMLFREFAGLQLRTLVHRFGNISFIHAGRLRYTHVMGTEIWKPIPGLEPFEASSHGQIRSNRNGKTRILATRLTEK